MRDSCPVDVNFVTSRPNLFTNRVIHKVAGLVQRVPIRSFLRPWKNKSLISGGNFRYESQRKTRFRSKSVK